MHGTRTDFEPIVTTFVLVGDDDRPRRRYGTRPSRHEQRRTWLPKQYGGRQ